MLATARREYDQQQRLTALAVNESLRLANRPVAVVARSIRTYQAAAVAVSMGALDGLLDEQGISTASDATVQSAALLTEPQPLSRMLGNVDSESGLARMVQTLVVDASRTARAVDAVTRPAVTGYIRSLSPPSCARCAVLAGRVYRHSQGFQRHPRCDCLMTPTNESVGRSLVTQPDITQIRGLSKADTDAVKAGADLGQVVNVRRKEAGLVVGSSVFERAGRLTPQGCLSLASTRTEQLALLSRYGYIT